MGRLFTAVTQHLTPAAVNFFPRICMNNFSKTPALVAYLDERLTGDQEVVGSNPRRVGKILSWRFDHEMFSMVILSLLLTGICHFLAKECAQSWLTT